MEFNVFSTRIFVAVLGVNKIKYTEKCTKIYYYNCRTVYTYKNLI